MNGNTKTRKTALLALGASFFLAAALAGCADMNDNGPNYPTLSLPMGELLKDVGYSPASSDPTALSQPVVSPTQSLVRTVVVGAIAIWSKETGDDPYDNTTPISDLGESVNPGQAGTLQNDLMNSSDNLVLVYLDELEAGVDSVEIPLPFPGARQWQIVGAGFSTHPNSILDLTNSPHSEALNYFGFDPRFLETETDGSVVERDSGDTVEEIVLNMQRACLVENPPNGCAQYDANGDIQITSSVEILSVTAGLVGGGTQILNPIAGSFPIIVRDATDAANAFAVLSETNGFLGFNSLSLAGVSSFTVEVTHSESLNEAAACQALSDTSPTVGQLSANCTVDTFVVNL